nr:DUF2285 domain-containing protein [Bradyrhizobium zhanjiangense]
MSSTVETAARPLEGCDPCARTARASYRVIAEVPFGRKRVPDRAWKTHDLRNRRIRLVQAGLALMRGGYRKILRPGRRGV